MRGPASGDFKRAAGWNAAALVAQTVGQVAILAIAFRALPADTVGYFVLATAIYNAAAALDPALGYLVAGDVARHRASTDETPIAQAAINLGKRTALVPLALALVAFGASAAIRAPVSDVLLLSGLMLLALSLQLSTLALPATALGSSQFRSMALASLASAMVGIATAMTAAGPWGLAGLGLAQLSAITAQRLVLRIRLSASRQEANEKTMSAGATVRAVTPLLLGSWAAQVMPLFDLSLTASLSGPAMSASYRVGSAVPSQVANLLYRIYGVYFPRLAAMRGPDHIRLLRDATAWVASLAGATYIAIAIGSAAFVEIVVGTPDALATSVMIIYTMSWALNAPLHGIALSLVSTGRQNALTPLIWLEAAMSAIGATALGLAIGPLGVALGRLIASAVSNLVVQPLRLRQLEPQVPSIVATGLGREIAWAGLASVALLPTLLIDDALLRLALISAICLPILALITRGHGPMLGRDA